MNWKGEGDEGSVSHESTQRLYHPSFRKQSHGNIRQETWSKGGGSLKGPIHEMGLQWNIPGVILATPRMTEKRGCEKF